MKKLLTEPKEKDLIFASTLASDKKNKVGDFRKSLSVISIGFLLGAGLSIAGLIQVNNFFNKHYFEFRSPIIFQAPIILHDRDSKMLVPVPESDVVSFMEVAPTASPTPEPKKTCLQKYPSMPSKYPVITEKLKAAFPGEYEQAAELLCRESAFKADAVNKSSGACGLFQANPCKKMDCALTDIDCQIAWGKKYIEGRYQNVTSAVAFHDAKKAECLAKDPSNTKCEGWY